MNIEEMQARIDVVADAVRAKLVGDPVRAFEYQAAEQGALLFKSVGYTGQAPSVVQCWADAKGWSAQQAADDILTEAQKYHSALLYIREIRLQGKCGLAGLSLDDANVTFAKAINDLKLVVA